VVKVFGTVLGNLDPFFLFYSAQWFVELRSQQYQDMYREQRSSKHKSLAMQTFPNSGVQIVKVQNGDGKPKMTTFSF
jgi:hypothetical protein